MTDRKPVAKSMGAAETDKTKAMSHTPGNKQGGTPKTNHTSRVNGEPMGTPNKSNSDHRSTNHPISTPKRPSSSQRLNTRSGAPPSRNGSGAHTQGHPTETPKTPSSDLRRPDQLMHTSTGKPGHAIKTAYANSVMLRIQSSRPLLGARSAFTPLTRSMSVRVSKKERKWTERLADPKTPAASTYQDDYQSPDELSHRLHSLNLEVPSGTEQSADSVSSPTTYRDSFQWRPYSASVETKERLRTRGMRSVSSVTDTNQQELSVSSRNGAQSQTTVLVSKRNNPSLSENGLTSTFASRHSSASSNEDASQARPTMEKTTVGSVTNDRYKTSNVLSASGVQAGSSSANGNRLQSTRNRQQSDGVAGFSFSGGDSETSKTPSRPRFNPQMKSSLWDSGFGLSESEPKKTTPQRSRPNSQQSPSGGSPFVYGSGSGAWV